MIRRLLLCLLALSLTLSFIACGSGGSSSTSPLTITTSTLPAGVINAPYNVTLVAAGGATPYAWSLLSGNLPAGLSLSRAGVISGTPSAAGTSSFSVAVADSQHPPSIATATLSLAVSAALQITTSNLVGGSIGVGYSQTLAATGGLSPYSWMITQGSLPQGLMLNASGGVISGTPAGSGTSTFTVQVSDSETPAATATTSLSIVINTAPTRSSALYLQGLMPLGDNSQVAGFAIAKDGSLSALTTLPEGFFTLTLTASPKLPLLFTTQGPGTVDSLLVNPDYSLSAYSSITLETGATGFFAPAVDPTGADLYLLGGIDAGGSPGVTIVTADGSFNPVGTVAIPNISGPATVFTPDGTLAFVSTCAGNLGNLLSFVRNSDGTLRPAGSIATSSGGCLGTLAVSADGKYLASDEVQVYNIAVNGTLTPVLASPFTVTLDGNSIRIPATSLSWDASGSYLIVAGWAALGVFNIDGGVGVLSFSGTDLTQTAPLTGGAMAQVQRTGSFVYAMPESYTCGACGNILGFSFQNGQLTPLPGSPYSNASGTMAIY
jgi:hypothetical protein